MTHLQKPNLNGLGFCLKEGGVIMHIKIFHRNIKKVQWVNRGGFLVIAA
ncbi:MULTISPECIES: hypothetical protein [Acinetobacter]|uniref:Transposase n=1 Tax=Acinetobacter entericus TaxID=2989714 RepID=A0ABT3NJ70_9GAMM|nr:MULTISPECIES: hypothetical protein [Acinetobacter]MCW8039611.1 hypothetical protein [Acinetobacter entericus]QXW27424.1 hypothetical protein KXJ74_08605 [Acinetobacter johnsonii]